MVCIAGADPEISTWGGCIPLTPLRNNQNHVTGIALKWRAKSLADLRLRF